MDTKSQRSAFPQFAAREKAHTLERFARKRPALETPLWKSWSDLASYSAKRLGLLSERSMRPLQLAVHDPRWFTTSRENVSRISRLANENLWKRTIDISIRRFRGWWEPPVENQLWMAVALIEASRLAKRTGKRKPILPGWAGCFTRNRFRVNCKEPVLALRSSWGLCALRNTKVRFSRSNSPDVPAVPEIDCPHADHWQSRFRPGFPN